MIDWKIAALLTIFASALIAAPFFKRVPKDLTYFIAGAITLLIGITPAKDFIANMTSGVLISCLFFFLLVSVAKDLLLDRTLRIASYKDLAKLLPEHWITLAFAGLFFMSAFEQTILPEKMGELLVSLLGENPFFHVGFFLVIIYLLAQFFPPLFIFFLAYPFCVETLQLCIRTNDATVAGALISLFATLFSSLSKHTKERVHAKVRLPVLILILLLCAFLIPQFLLVK